MVYDKWNLPRYCEGIVKRTSVEIVRDALMARSVLEGSTVASDGEE